MSEVPPGPAGASGSMLAFGRYEIRRELGRGAMGVVFEAHDPSRGVDVALKVMSNTGKSTPEARRRQVDRFVREAKALGALSHPGVVKVFDQGELGGRQYFTMELVKGTTLKDRLLFQGALSLPELYRITRELCDALAHLHRHGVVHCDVKPENVMLMPDGTIKLMDFGIARLEAEAAEAASGGFQASPAYMSPEQALGAKIDRRTDIYSLAVTLYQASTGKRAFEGETIPQLTHKILNEYPAPPSGLPAPFQAALMKAMSKRVEHRFGTAEEFLRAVQAQESAPAPPPAPVTGRSAPTAVYLGDPTGSEFILPGAGGQNSLHQTVRIPPPNHSSATPPPMTGWGAPQSATPATSAGCHLHPRVRAASVCSACGEPMCYTCLLEIPGRGPVCRACAFGTR